MAGSLYCCRLARRSPGLKLNKWGFRQTWIWARREPFRFSSRKILPVLIAATRTMPTRSLIHWPTATSADIGNEACDPLESLRPKEFQLRSARNSIEITEVIEWRDGEQHRVSDYLAGEEPLEIRIGATPLTVTMRTPG